jgi:hypothetical protein
VADKIIPLSVDCDSKFLEEVCIAQVTGLLNGDFASWYVIIKLLLRGFISPVTEMEDKDKLIVEQSEKCFVVC